MCQFLHLGIFGGIAVSYIIINRGKSLQRSSGLAEMSLFGMPGQIRHKVTRNSSVRDEVFDTGHKWRNKIKRQ